MERLVTRAELAVAEATVDHGDESTGVRFVLEFHDAKIANLVACWAKPFEPMIAHFAKPEPIAKPWPGRSNDA